MLRFLAAGFGLVAATSALVAGAAFGLATNSAAQNAVLVAALLGLVFGVAALLRWWMPPTDNTGRLWIGRLLATVAILMMAGLAKLFADGGMSTTKFAAMVWPLMSFVGLWTAAVTGAPRWGYAVLITSGLASLVGVHLAFSP